MSATINQKIYYLRATYYTKAWGDVYEIVVFDSIHDVNLFPSFL